MDQGCRPGLFLLVMGLLAIPSLALAQPARVSRSQRPYVAVTPDGDLEQILKNNLERVRGLKNMRSILDRLSDSPLFENSKWAQTLKRLQDTPNLDLNHPVAKKAYQDVMKQFEKDPQLLEKAKKIAPDLANLKKLDEINKVIEKDEPPSDNAGKDNSGPRSVPPSRLPNRPPAQNLDSGNEEDFAQTVQDWLERAKSWRGVGDLLSQSPAIQEAIDDLTVSMLSPEGGGDWGTVNGWSDRLGNVADFADGGFNLLGEGWGGVSNLPLPSLPPIHLPNLSLGGLPSLGLPNLGTPGAGGGGLAFGQFMLWTGLVVSIGLILWQLLGRVSGRGSAAGAAASWRLGPWPVDPAQVATRAEVIQAFEYLSLLRLGQAARTWNHRDIAVGLGAEATGGTTPQRSAADRLAALYEQARYAPGEEPLDGETLAEARRNLCLLAGVAAA